MKVEVSFTYDEVAGAELEPGIAVVIDVLRATSTIVEALANGAQVVSPVASIEEAVRIADALGREEALLCGERGSERIEGFDLGNSPREYTREAVTGRRVVLTTTNGTPALLAAARARRTLIGSFLNLSAVADAAAADGGPVAIVCAGRERRFALEDAICAGALVLALRERAGALEMNDAALVAGYLARHRAEDAAGPMRETAAGRQLAGVGLEEDVAFCAALDRHEIVPELRDGQIIL